MAATNPKLPLTGRNITLFVFINGSPTQATDLAKSVTITEQVVRYRDKYLGRDRDRPDEQTIGYDAQIELDYAGAQLISALLAQKAARQALLPVPVISIGLTMSNRDGSADSYVLQNCTTQISIKMPGKDDRGTTSLDIQAEDLKLSTGI